MWFVVLRPEQKVHWYRSASFKFSQHFFKAFGMHLSGESDRQFIVFTQSTKRHGGHRVRFRGHTHPHAHTHTQFIFIFIANEQNRRLEVISSVQLTMGQSLCSYVCSVATAG